MPEQKISCPVLCVVCGQDKQNTRAKSDILATVLAVMLVGLPLIISISNSYPPNAPTITSIRDINDGLVPLGANVTVIGTVDMTTEAYILLIGDGGTIYIMGTGYQPLIGTVIRVSGTVNTPTRIIEATILPPM
ncbi:MAG: hypothetical protein EAX95_12205 [Candidatus Thorarchaeota archaeon]|nr:hypothetical protein [Candidatus Thorarchaeota archaeon]